MYHSDAIDGMKFEVMRHMMAGANLGLISARSNKSQIQDQFFVTDQMSEVKLGEATTGSVLYPLWLYPTQEATQTSSGQASFSLDEQGTNTPTANIGQLAKDRLQDDLGLVFVDTDEGDLITTVGARDIFDYTYAVVHSRTYRLRYEQFLRSDYPRIPITRDLETFRSLRKLGRQLSDLHVLKAADLDTGLVNSPTHGNNVVDSIPVSKRWSETSDLVGQIILNTDGGKSGGSQIIAGVPERVWRFQVGGIMCCISG
jgi:predicted helicase